MSKSLAALHRAIAAAHATFAEAIEPADIEKNDELALSTGTTDALTIESPKKRGRPPGAKNAAAPAPAQAELELGDGDPLGGIAEGPAKPAAPKVPDEADLHVAMRNLAQKHGRPAAESILKRCKVAKLSEIKAEHYDRVIAACEAETAKPKAK